MTWTSTFLEACSSRDRMETSVGFKWCWSVARTTFMPIARHSSVPRPPPALAGGAALPHQGMMRVYFKPSIAAPARRPDWPNTIATTGEVVVVVSACRAAPLSLSA